MNVSHINRQTAAFFAARGGPGRAPATALVAAPAPTPPAAERKRDEAAAMLASMRRELQRAHLKPAERG